MGEQLKVEVNFNKEIDGIVGDNADTFFKDTLVRVLKSSSTVQSISESEALRDLRGEIARAEGPIELTESDLELLENNIDRALQNEGTRIPNNFVEEIVDLIGEGRNKLNGAD